MLKMAIVLIQDPKSQILASTVFTRREPLVVQDLVGVVEAETELSGVCEDPNARVEMASGWVIITDIAARLGGTITNKIYQDPGTDTVIQSCTSDVGTITVSIKASYPLVDVEGTPAILTRATDGGHYEGDVDIDLSASGAITITITTPDNQQGAQDTAYVTIV